MAELHFYYGVMGSSKSAEALITKFNYEKSKNSVMLLKPKVDNRSKGDTVESRIGLSAPAIPVDYDQSIMDILVEQDADVVIVDEAQFFTSDQIDELHYVACYLDIPVICYGLLTDFQTHLFPGSKRLVEVSDVLSPITTTIVCACGCGNRATINARLVNGKVVKEGDQVVIGGDESYRPMCYKCYIESL